MCVRTACEAGVRGRRVRRACEEGVCEENVCEEGGEEGGEEGL